MDVRFKLGERCFCTKCCFIFMQVAENPRVGQQLCGEIHVDYANCIFEVELGGTQIRMHDKD